MAISNADNKTWRRAPSRDDKAMRLSRREDSSQARNLLGPVGRLALKGPAPRIERLGDRDAIEASRDFPTFNGGSPFAPGGSYLCGGGLPNSSRRALTFWQAQSLRGTEAASESRMWTCSGGEYFGRRPVILRRDDPLRRVQWAPFQR
jgi:hypothetical protein